MKKLLLGNEAVARGLYEAGVTVVSSYPGTPSTEVTEEAAKYDEIKAEWAPNEKVACEVAAGAAIAGARSFCAMKHVGMNVAADPMFTASYTGVNGGMVIFVADDPGMHSSQNEQDSRHYAKAAKLMMLEPADSDECLKFTKLAYELSERFDTPVIIRSTTRVAHSRSLAEIGDREEVKLREYVKKPGKNVMMPAMARGRHVVVEERVLAQKIYVETEALVDGINKIEKNDGAKIGVICNGISYLYAKEALGEKASYVKLGCTYPLPEKLLIDFAKDYEKVYVIEELDDVVEAHCKALGIKVIGKEIFSLLGEYSQATIRKAVLGEEFESLSADVNVPARPPVLCAGCPHRGLYYVLKKLNVFVSGDIGCYTLGALKPLGMLDTCICMGASISSLHGKNKADPASQSKNVAVIGDSTFIHSGINSLINVAYNQSNTVSIILDNSITGMTGHQQNPSTGITLKGDATAAVSLEKVCEAVGINKVLVCDPNDLVATEKAIREALEYDGSSVVISRRPCALLKTVKHNGARKVNAEKCRSCKMCMKIGCPAISMVDGKAKIDFTQCVGCDVCKQLCKFDAIED